MHANYQFFKNQNHHQKHCDKTFDTSTLSQTEKTEIKKKIHCVQFEPAFTLFVAKSWPCGVDKERFFTTITEALNVAALIFPFASGIRPVILISPGDYNNEGVLNLVSNVNLVSLGGARSTFIAGISWTPGIGINFSQAGLIEAITMDGFSFTLPPGITIDFSGKTGTAFTLFDLQNSFALGANITGSTTNPNTEVIFNNDDFNGSIVTTNLGSFVLKPFHFVIGNVSIGLIAGGSAFLQGGQIVGNVTAFNGTVVVDGMEITNYSAVNGNTSIIFGSKIDINISSDTSSTVDARASQITTLLGPGGIDRSIDTSLNGLVGVGLGGSQIVNIPVPFPNTSYNVILTPSNTLAIDHIPAVTVKTASTFTLTFSAATPAGSTYDITLVSS